MTDERTANAIDRKLGARVRARRLEIGMSQERLAELTRVTFQQIQKYEKGMNRIAASRLMDIADALKVPASALLDGLRSGNSKSESPADIAGALSVPGAHDLVRSYAGMPVKVRRRILSLVKAMGEEG